MVSTSIFPIFPSLPLSIMEQQSPLTKALLAQLGIPEPDSLGLGIRLLALLDTREAQSTPPPTLNEYKDAAGKSSQ